MLITRTKRSTSNYFHIAPKKKSFRMPLEVYLQSYNKIPSDFKSLKPHTFKKKLKKHDIDFVPAPWTVIRYTKIQRDKLSLDTQ